MLRRLAAGAAVALGMTLLVPAGQAQAVRGCYEGTYCGYVYYTDSLRTDISGVYLNYQGCENGEVLRWGTTTRWFEFITEPC